MISIKIFLGLEISIFVIDHVKVYRSDNMTSRSCKIIEKRCIFTERGTFLVLSGPPLSDSISKHSLKCSSNHIKAS